MVGRIRRRAVQTVSEREIENQDEFCATSTEFKNV